MPKLNQVALLLAATGVVLGSLACHTEAPTPDTNGAPRGRSPRAAVNAPATPRLNEGGYPVIVRLVGRHQTIVVTAGPTAPLYSATRNDGTPIVAAATLEQLRRDHPEVYQQLIPTIATEAKAASSRKSKSEDDPDKTDVADATRGPVSSTSDRIPVGLMLMSADR
jgi:hypothetical protein